MQNFRRVGIKFHVEMFFFTLSLVLQAVLQAVNSNFPTFQGV